MALNVDLRILTQPGAIGQQTLSLAANFDPKAIILWGAPIAAAGTGAHAQFCKGFGTYRGSVVQQFFASIDARDATGIGDTCHEQGADALFVILTAGAPGVRDLEIDLVSMQSGATSQVVIDWINLHTTASVKVNCLILGGSEITDALVLSFAMSTAVATQDVTVATGFGQPDLLFMANTRNTDANDIVAEGIISIGFGKKGQAGRSVSYISRDGNTVMFVGMSQRSDVIQRVPTISAGEAAIQASFSLDTDPATNWPADGFQVNYDVQASVANEIGVLALKGTFTATTGNGAAPTSGGLPVTQDLDHASVPKVALVFGWNLVANTLLVTDDVDLGAFFLGAGDGTVECVAGISDDDGLGTSDCNMFWSDAKVVQNYSAAAALQSEADGSITGNIFRLSWNDIDSIAREYQWLTLGDSAAAPAGHPAARRLPQPAPGVPLTTLRRM